MEKTILEHKVTGPAVVHYRMPDDMQALFEKKYRTTGYPSYLLIDKDGKLVTTEAPGQGMPPHCTKPLTNFYDLPFKLHPSTAVYDV